MTGRARLWLAGLVVAGRLTAAPIELPAELPLGAESQLLFELTNAEIRFTSRADGLPALTVRPLVEGAGGRLEVVSSGGSLTVRRAAGDGGEGRLVLDATLGPGRSVRIAGRELEVRVDDMLPADAGRSSFELELERSRAELSGTRVARIESTAGSVRLSATDGPLELRVTGGSADLRGHRGDLQLTADDAGVTVAEQRGELAVQVVGGSLEVIGGTGAATGTAHGAALGFDGWNGPVELAVSDGALDARGAGVEAGDWQIDGRDLEVVLREIRGTVTATLAGGGLRAGGLRGRVRLTAGSGARLELDDVTGSVELTLTDGAQAWLTGMRGTLGADLTDARLEAEKVERLTLRGARATVSARAIARLDRFETSDSELDLDLRGVGNEPSLELAGAGRARVLLAAPCIVELADAETFFDDPPEVIHCELRGPDPAASRRQDRLLYGRRPARLRVTLSPDTHLEVEGEG